MEKGFRERGSVNQEDRVCKKAVYLLVTMIETCMVKVCVRVVEGVYCCFQVKTS